MFYIWKICVSYHLIVSDLHAQTIAPDKLTDEVRDIRQFPL